MSTAIGEIIILASVAQLAEQGPCKSQVVGSSPTAGFKLDGNRILCSNLLVDF